LRSCPLQNRRQLYMAGRCKRSVQRLSVSHSYGLMLEVGQCRGQNAKLNDNHSHLDVAKLSHSCHTVVTFIRHYISMKIKDMTKKQLETNILLWEKRLHSPRWVRQQSNWKLGSRVVHLAKLRAELKSRL